MAAQPDGKHHTADDHYYGAGMTQPRWPPIVDVTRLGWRNESLRRKVHPYQACQPLVPAPVVMLCCLHHRLLLVPR
jgi:hypothetical protein